LAFTGLVLVAQAGPANAATVPWTDTHVDGSLTLCGRNDQPITSGSLLSAPFVWSAVSSSAAPKGYTGAYLVVYQPIQYVDPANWSGYQLTVEAVFSNQMHPMAQATNADLPLLFADHNYPPHWDNLYELRMYYTGVNKQPETTKYPAAVIRVSGNNWSLVQGGTTPCNSGTATSLESVQLPKSEIDTPQTLAIGPAGHSTSGGGSSRATNHAGSKGSESSRAAHAQASGPSTTASSGAIATRPANSEAAAANGSNGSGANPALIAAMIVVLVAAIVGAGVFLWRRRHLAGSQSG
jgi:hypothetical protein